MPDTTTTETPARVAPFFSKSDLAAIKTAERLVRECREHMNQPRPIQDREHLLNMFSVVLVQLLLAIGDYDRKRETSAAMIARMLATLVADLEDAPLVAGEAS